MTKGAGLLERTIIKPSGAPRSLETCRRYAQSTVLCPCIMLVAGVSDFPTESLARVISSRFMRLNFQHHAVPGLWVLVVSESAIDGDRIIVGDGEPNSVRTAAAI